MPREFPFFHPQVKQPNKQSWVTGMCDFLIPLLFLSIYNELVRRSWSSFWSDSDSLQTFRRSGKIYSVLVFIDDRPIHFHEALGKIILKKQYWNIFVKWCLEDCTMHGNSKSKESGDAFWNNNSFQCFFFFSQKILGRHKWKRKASARNWCLMYSCSLWVLKKRL